MTISSNGNIKFDLLYMLVSFVPCRSKGNIAISTDGNIEFDILYMFPLFLVGAKVVPLVLAVLTSLDIKGLQLTFPNDEWLVDEGLLSMWEYGHHRWGPHFYRACHLSRSQT